MTKKLFSMLLLAMMTLGTLSACETMGRATGETAEEVEQGAEEFKEGYEKGKSN